MLPALQTNLGGAFVVDRGEGEIERGGLDGVDSRDNRIIHADDLVALQLALQMRA